MQTSGPLRGHSSLRAVSPGAKPPADGVPRSMRASTWETASPLPNPLGPTWAVGSPPASPVQSAERDRTGLRAGMRRRRRSCPMPPNGAGRTSPPASRSRPRVGPGRCLRPGRKPVPPVSILRGRPAQFGPEQNGARGTVVVLPLPPRPARPPCRMGGVGRAGPGCRVAWGQGRCSGAPGLIGVRVYRRDCRIWAWAMAAAGCDTCGEGKGWRAAGSGKTGRAPGASKVETSRALILHEHD